MSKVGIMPLGKTVWQPSPPVTFRLPLYFVEPVGERTVAEAVCWWPWTTVACRAFYAGLDVTVP